MPDATPPFASEDPSAGGFAPLVYSELRRLAHRQLRHERTGHTLTTTALVHEAYLRLASRPEPEFRNRIHFLATAARAMRRILVDYARERHAQKRGGGAERIGLDDAGLVADDRAEEFLALDESLERLSRVNERLSQVVEYRFFGGLSEEEIAEAMGITARTVRRDWLKARGWLLRDLEG